MLDRRSVKSISEETKILVKKEESWNWPEFPHRVIHFIETGEMPKDEVVIIYSPVARSSWFSWKFLWPEVCIGLGFWLGVVDAVGWAVHYNSGGV